MKLLFTLLTTLALAVGISAPAQAQTVTINLSNNTPAVGETVVVTVTITNTDSVARTLGAQAGITPQTSSFSCHPGKAFYTGTQNAIYQPGQSISYTTTLIAPDPSCVPNNDWVIYGRVQDVTVAGAPILATAFTDMTVQ